MEQNDLEKYLKQLVVAFNNLVTATNAFSKVLLACPSLEFLENKMKIPTGLGIEASQDLSGFSPWITFPLSLTGAYSRDSRKSLTSHLKCTGPAPVLPEKPSSIPSTHRWLSTSVAPVPGDGLLSSAL